MKHQQDSGELYLAKLHWILFFWPIVMAVAAMLLGIEFPPLKIPALLMLGFALVWLVMTWVSYHFSSLTIKKNQIILRTGLLVRKTIDIPMTKIESIDIRQSILGSIFRYGILIITGTGGTRHAIAYLDRPLTCRRYIEQLMHA